jgi:hypothetical protein
MDAITDMHNDVLGILIFIITFVGVMLVVTIIRAYRTPTNQRLLIDSVPLLE